MFGSIAEHAATALRSVSVLAASQKPHVMLCLTIKSEVLVGRPKSCAVHNPYISMTYAIISYNTHSMRFCFSRI